MKRYLGDGVYAEWVHGGSMIKLTAENGISATDTIYLEHWVFNALRDFAGTNPNDQPTT